ncbi:MAG: DNA-binding protein [Bacteroidota bacterium]|nr:DNA-binding protein [Bacteroidota bacterium]
MNFLRKPYPHSQSLKRLMVSSVCIGIFIGLFLIIFQPFDSDTIPDTSFRIAFLGGYGLITIVASIFFGLILRFLFPTWSDEKNWTTGKEILGVTSIILFVSILNMIYTNVVFNRTFTPMQIPSWALITMLVSIIPVSFSVILRQGKMNAESEVLAKSMNVEIEHRKEEMPLKSEPETEAWTFSSETEKEKIETGENELLFIESADNYSSFYFFENGQLKKQLLRGSLKKMEEQVKHSSLYRCHRTYIVNLSNVITVSGNAQGYKLHFEGTELAVPVSRNLGKELKERLK